MKIQLRFQSHHYHQIEFCKQLRLLPSQIHHHKFLLSLHYKKYLKFQKFNFKSNNNLLTRIKHFMAPFLHKTIKYIHYLHNYEFPRHYVDNRLWFILIENMKVNPAKIHHNYSFMIFNKMLHLGFHRVKSKLLMRKNH